MTAESKERRKSPRGDVRAYAGLMDPKSILEDQKISVSVKGSYLKTKSSFKVGQEVVVVLGTREMKRFIHLKARVIRVEKTSGRLKYGVGVEFFDVPPREVNMLREIVRTSKFTLPKTIVLCKDDDLFRLMTSKLTEDRYDVVRVKSMEEFSKKAGREGPTLAIADIEPAVESLEELRNLSKNSAVVVVAEEIKPWFRSLATKLKIFEFVSKPLDPDKFVISVGNALEALRRSEETSGRIEVVEVARKGKTEEIETIKLPRLVARADPMLKAYKTLRNVARVPDILLLSGESGVGKEVFTLWAHVLSGRGDHPFITVDIPTLPPSLIESELFGHVKGAFTGADENKAGLFETAGKGTVFLDEIGELGPKLQPKLLGAIDRKRFRRVGGTKTVKLVARVIVATNRDLDEMVRTGGFRADLRNRLKIHQITIPPLRERSMADRNELVEAIFEDLNEEYKTNVQHLGPEASSQLMEHSWPGNVRELINAIRKAIPFVKGDTLERFDLDEDVPNADSIPSGLTNLIDFKKTLRTNRDVVDSAFEKTYCGKICDMFGWNITKAADHAGVSRQFLNRLLRKHGMSGSFAMSRRMES